MRKTTFFNKYLFYLDFKFYCTSIKMYTYTFKIVYIFFINSKFY